MIKTLTLKNFRQHTETTLQFNLGLSVLRGNNEIGKSTVFEGIAYALFGVGALRDSLDDVVTWGCPVNSLKAELELGVDGVTYDIKRSKSGAELTSDGLTVTGQKEVSSYVAKLLKVDAGAAARLTMSNQLEIRGTLEAGPKATTELIERLAEFDQIDNLIELMQEKLTLGSSATVEAAIAAAQATLDMATEAAVPFDEAGAARQAEAATLASDRAQTAEAQAVKAEAAAHDAHSSTRARIVARDSLVRNAQRAADSMQELRTRLSVALPAAPVNVEGRIEALRQDIANIENAGAIAAVYAKVKPYLAPRTTSEIYEGTSGDIVNAIGEYEQSISKLKVQATQLSGEIKLHTASLTHGSCTFCGKDFSGVPEVAEKNSATQAALDEAVRSMSIVEGELEVEVARLALLRRVEAASRAVWSVYASAGEYTKLVDNTLPPVLKWVGPEVGAIIDPSTPRREIASLREQQRAYDAAVTRRSEVEAQLATAEAAYTKAHAELAAAGEPETLEAAQTALDAARAAANAARRETAAASLPDLETLGNSHPCLASNRLTAASALPTRGTRRSVAASLCLPLVRAFGTVHQVPSPSCVMCSGRICTISAPRVQVQSWIVRKSCTCWLNLCISPRSSVPSSSSVSTRFAVPLCLPSLTAPLLRSFSPPT